MPSIALHAGRPRRDDDSPRGGTEGSCAAAAAAAAAAFGTGDLGIVFAAAEPWLYFSIRWVCFAAREPLACRCVSEAFSEVAEEGDGSLLPADRRSRRLRFFFLRQSSWRASALAFIVRLFRFFLWFSLQKAAPRHPPAMPS